MGPASHFLFGALCGAALGSVAMVLAPASRRPRVALWLPPAVLASGLWAEAPYLLGMPETTARLANIFFGYAWLHPWLAGGETAAFAAVVVVANLFLLGYVAFLSWTFSTAALLRWEQEGGRRGRRRSAASADVADGSRDSREARP
jgi:hypothetical protein